MGTRAAIGIGAVAESAAGLPASREGADRSLRVIRSGQTEKRVACIGEVGFHSLLIEFGDLITARGEPLEGPIGRLDEYDAKHKTNLVATLQAWLDNFGDVVAASKETFVHPNTFRYRLRRLAEVGEVDLADPEARFGVMLQLRVFSA
jgi:sugar diacid utilization regulator